MKKYVLLFVLVFIYQLNIQAQLTTLPSGGNKKAWVGERIGITDVTISYNRPGVKGRDGKIWGQLVYSGFTDLGFGSSKSSPWRAGANENTTIEFSTDVKVEGQPLKAGKYGLFVSYDSVTPTVIFSTNNSSWGSYFYNEKEDALRVKVKAMPAPANAEWLKYEFINQQENSATVALQWEKTMIPFTIETDYINLQLESFRKELRSDKGFTWTAWNEAAQWALQHNTNLEEALTWTNSAVDPNFGGNNLFEPWSTKAQILRKLGKTAEADAVIKKAMPLAHMNELHQYGRQLLQQKKTTEALEIFKNNYEKHPNEFTTAMGLVRGYSANADYKNALKYAQLALPLAPAGPNKTFLQEAVEKLKQGEDIN
jgi:tetratricopeptide (TPR) repeat protein